MGHKIIKALLGLSLVAIVVPLVSRVNTAAGTGPCDITSPVRIADGNPGPPLPPPKSVEAQFEQPVLFADGNPGPPLPPPKGPGVQFEQPVLVADGNPGPPLPPPTGRGTGFSSESVLTADGNPGPPLPPPTKGLFQIESQRAA